MTARLVLRFRVARRSHANQKLTRVAIFFIGCYSRVQHMRRFPTPKYRAIAGSGTRPYRILRGATAYGERTLSASFLSLSINALAF